MYDTSYLSTVNMAKTSIHPSCTTLSTVKGGLDPNPSWRRQLIAGPANTGKQPFYLTFPPKENVVSPPVPRLYIFGQEEHPKRRHVDTERTCKLHTEKIHLTKYLYGHLNITDPAVLLYKQKKNPDYYYLITMFRHASKLLLK